MKQKLKYFILIPLLALSILPVLLAKEKTKATDYLTLTMLDNGSIEDLPDENTTNTWNINKWIYCSFNYNGNNQYLLNYYSTTTNYNILYCTEKFTNESLIELEDDSYYDIYNDDLMILLKAIKEQIDLIEVTNRNQQIYYINYNYYNSIGYYQNGFNKPLLVDTTYEDYYSNYITNYGILNSIYQQYNLYQKTLSYYEMQIQNNQVNYNEVYQEVNNYYNDLLNNVNEQWQTELNEQVLQWYNEGYQAGIIYGQTHPNDTINYDLTYMFKVISLYPINFFTEGLNVQLFGINIGDLILGIFMIALLIIIIRMILSIIRGGR